MDSLLGPASIRTCFAAPSPELVLFSADLDQVELRVAGALSGEPTLIQAAREGTSLHAATARVLYGNGYSPDQYKKTKGANFGWLYGGGTSVVAQTAGIPVREAVTLMNQYRSQLPKLVTYKKEQETNVLRKALGDQYAHYITLRREYFTEDRDPRIKRTIDRMLEGRSTTVRNPFGHPLIVEARNAFRVVNYIVQSTARDLFSRGLLKVMNDRLCGPTIRLLIHDEVLGVTHRDNAERVLARCCELMREDFMGVPITASGNIHGSNWGESYKK